MKILFVASEAYPFIKTGGMGDVAYALPKALRKLGIDVRVIIPKYSSIPLPFESCMENIATFNVEVGWRNQYCGLECLTYGEVPYYIVDKLEELLSLDLQIVLLGNGDGYYEDIFQNYASRYPSKISTNIIFDEELARQIYAASDMFLMPSLFEPCGLGQLIALKYGSIPIIRETGGLKDTIIPYNKFTGEGNGFTFTNYNSQYRSLRKSTLLGRDGSYYHNSIIR